VENDNRIHGTVLQGIALVLNKQGRLPLTCSRRDENADKEGEATQCSNLLAYNQRQNIAKRLLVDC
jgi:hypothetical protein